MPTRGYALRDTEGNLIGGTSPSVGFPSGAIVMWSGLLANIPTGWLLCDGQNGTPDLRDRFVRGAAAGQDPGGTGGAATHSHADHAELAHAGTAVSAHAGTAVADHPALTHSGCAVASHSTVSNKQGSASGTVVTTATHTVTQPAQHAAQAHTVTQPAAHTVTQPNSHPAQTHAASDNLPPFLALAFIMKT